MKRSITFLIYFWVLLLLVMVLQKPLFMLVESDYEWTDFASLWQVVRHGLSMDLSMSAYFVAPVVLWLIAALWVRHRAMPAVLNGYIWFVSAVISIVYVVDMALYPYWKFHLDATPIFYVTTAPAAAFASVSWWFVLLGIVAMVVVAGAIHKLLSVPVKRIFKNYGRIVVHTPVVATIVMLVVAGLLIIPIRGGVTVSTMSPGRAYFCADMRMNQAAVNPIFNFMHSVTHVDNLASQFHYYGDDDVRKYIASLDRETDVDSVAEGVHLRVERPDVYLIILESFSAHLMPSLGGEPIAMCLDSIANEGVLFTDFYAESFRTDRGLATILSGYPALATTSVFRYSNKFDKLPSLSMQLKEAGYSTSYFYGGDINFTNMNAYLVSGGFDHIVKDTDFAVEQRLSKWGAHDDVVFARALSYKAKSPSFMVIQTSSSHEPFEVPYHKLENARANSFAYADSCLGNYIRTLKATKAWSNALVVIVPDHWGAYPENVTDPLKHQHIPLVLTGGALAGTPARISNTGSQSAIAPTVLKMLGIEPKGFVAPRNLLDTRHEGYAWMAIPEWFGIKQGDKFTQVIVNTGEVAQGTTEGEHQAKAFLQNIYRDLEKR